MQKCLLLSVFLLIYIFKGNCIIIFWHVMYINFVEDKPWILYVLDMNSYIDFYMYSYVKLSILELILYRVNVRISK